MVGVVNFLHKVGHRQLQLMHPEPPGFRLRRQPVTRAEIEQDVGGLPDYELAGFEKRWGEWRGAAARLHHFHHRSRTALARDIGIMAAGGLEREPDKFTAALDLGPVIEFVGHGHPRSVIASDQQIDARLWFWRRSTRAGTLVKCASDRDIGRHSSGIPRLILYRGPPRPRCLSTPKNMEPDAMNDYMAALRERWGDPLPDGAHRAADRHAVCHRAGPGAGRHSSFQALRTVLFANHSHRPASFLMSGKPDRRGRDGGSRCVMATAGARKVEGLKAPLAPR